MRIIYFTLSLLISAKLLAVTSGNQVHLGPRPFYLIDSMKPGPLKDKLESCQNLKIESNVFSIGHRGAPLQFPEHTKESYAAAARMGAGIIECDVTFTKDKQLVCRHSQCDLHTTTNILEKPELAKKCRQPFKPYNRSNNKSASAQCCTSDITLAEFKTLCGKMDAFNPKAGTVTEYLGGTADFRTDLYASCGTLLSHQESIELFKKLKVQMTPELKAPMVKMPFDGFSQQDYAQLLIKEYKIAKVQPNKVWPQSFNLNDVLYWITKEPAFGNQAVYLDGRYENPNFDITQPDSWQPSMAELRKNNINYLAPPLWMLVQLDSSKKIIPSLYGKTAKKAGLNLITWTLERSGPLANGGGFYYQTIDKAITRDGDMYELLHVLSQDLGITGIFSDWPAVTTYYANCFSL